MRHSLSEKSELRVSTGFPLLGGMMVGGAIGSGAVAAEDAAVGAPAAAARIAEMDGDTEGDSAKPPMAQFDGETPTDRCCKNSGADPTVGDAAAAAAAPVAA